MARKPKPINWDEVDQFIKHGESQKTIAAYYDITDETLLARVRKDFPQYSDYSAYAQAKKAEGMVLVRDNLFKQAMKGNVYAMKRLDRFIRNELEEDSEKVPQSPFQTQIDINHENMRLKAQLQLMKDKYETGMDADQSQTG